MKIIRMLVLAVCLFSTNAFAENETYEFSCFCKVPKGSTISANKASNQCPGCTAADCTQHTCNIVTRDKDEDGNVVIDHDTIRCTKRYTVIPKDDDDESIIIEEPEQF